MSTFVTLSTGQRMPLVGLGTWKSGPGQVVPQTLALPTTISEIINEIVFGLCVSLCSQVKQAVLAALDCGYRHIDCAAAYSNEQEVGEALAVRLGPGKVRNSELSLN